MYKLYKVPVELLISDNGDKQILVDINGLENGVKENFMNFLAGQTVVILDDGKVMGFLTDYIRFIFGLEVED